MTASPMMTAAAATQYSQVNLPYDTLSRKKLKSTAKKISIANKKQSNDDDNNNGTSRQFIQHMHAGRLHWHM